MEIEKEKVFNELKMISSLLTEKLTELIKFSASDPRLLNDEARHLLLGQAIKLRNSHIGVMTLLTFKNNVCAEMILRSMIEQSAVFFVAQKMLPNLNLALLEEVLNSFQSKFKLHHHAFGTVDVHQQLYGPLNASAHGGIDGAEAFLDRSSFPVALQFSPGAENSLGIFYCSTSILMKSLAPLADLMYEVNVLDFLSSVSNRLIKVEFFVDPDFK